MSTRESNLGGSSERFGYEWETYASILPEYEEQFRRWMPFFLPEDWSVAIDLDERSLAAARINLQSYPSVEVCNCSAYDLLWRDEFDIAFAIGPTHQRRPLFWYQDCSFKVCGYPDRVIEPDRRMAEQIAQAYSPY